jgi:hypothetical protein
VWHLRSCLTHPEPDCYKNGMRSSDRDLRDVVTLSVRLKEVQDQRQALEAEEASIKAKIRLMLRDSSVGDASIAEPPTDTTVVKPSLSVWVLDVLASAPGRAFTVQEIADGIVSKGNPCELPSLRSTLARLATQKKAVNVGRGQYQSVRGDDSEQAMSHHPALPYRHVEEGTH